MISCMGTTHHEDSRSSTTYVDQNTFQQYAEKIAELESLLQEQTMRVQRLELKVATGSKANKEFQRSAWDLEAQEAQGLPSPGAASAVALANSGILTPRPHSVHTSHHQEGEDVNQVVPNPRHASRKATAKRTIFDKDLVQAICEKPYRRARNRGAMAGGGLLGLMSMPFGPIGMAAGSLLGATVGAGTGAIIDWRTMNQKLQQNEKEIRRLKSFLRWAQDRFHEDEEIIKLLEMVVLEFKPVADIAAGSRSARSLLRMLEKWVSQRKVNRNLWRYMEELLKEWKDLNRSDFLRSMTVFQILSTMYQYSTRVLSEQEEEFVHRMRTLLAHESVKLVMTHAQNYPTSGETRVMECMVYADAHSNADRSGQRSVTSVPGLWRRHPSGSGGGLLMPGHTDSGDALEVGDDDLAGEQPEMPLDRVASKASSRKASPRGHSDDEGKEPTQMVLKKPFFKNWEDFMEFDISLKHQMSITLSEFQLLLDKKDESMKGWDLCVDRKEIRVAKVQSGEGNIMLRAWATLPNVDHLVAFYMFFDIQERMRWDKVFANMDIIEKNKQGADVLYSLLKMPGVTQRDFLQFRRVRVLDDGSIAIVMRSAEHERCPEDKRYIRAESFISGYHLEKEWDGDTPVLKLFIMTCTDVKGLIPKWIVNYMAPKKPAEWVESLRSAAASYQKNNPGYDKVLTARLEEFKKENPWDYEPQIESPPPPKVSVPSVPMSSERGTPR